MYKQRNGFEIIANEIRLTVKKDKNILDAYLKGCGWAYVAAGICCLPFTIIKVIRNVLRVSAWAFKKPVPDRKIIETDSLPDELSESERNAEHEISVDI